MKRYLVVLGCLAIGVLGCSLITGATQTDSADPDVVETPQSDSPAKPAGSQEQPPEKPAAVSLPTNTSCKELSFFLSADLAAGIKCFTVPESGGTEPSAIYPEHTKATLADYEVGGRMMQPVILILPVQSYRDLLPDIVDPGVSALQALIDGNEPGGDDLPFLPVQDARQLFFAKYDILDFQNGTGIRYITQYNKNHVPPNSHDLFYTFQGLTSDGEYWVSVILPMTHPSLWETAGVPTSTEYKTINQDPEAYYAKKMDLLNALQPRSFVPSLLDFDTLVASIIVQP